MLRSLYSAASGMLVQQANIDTISHNLSNVNTTGFKKGRAEFQDLMYAHVRAPLSQDSGIMVGQGARLSSVHRIMNGGTLQQSGGPYDLAIQGRGFFRVKRSDGTEMYTRDGSFHLDGQRRLVTADGHMVQGGKGTITIPEEATSVEVTTDGQIRYANNGTQKVVVLDKISLALFPNDAGLVSLGDNLWIETESSGRPNLKAKDAGSIMQGFLEASNVQVVEEMVSLIIAQRAYEINSKAVQVSDDMMGMANNLRRG